MESEYEYRCMLRGIGFKLFFFFKQKTAYEMCGRDWSSDVCSSDLLWIWTIDMQWFISIDIHRTIILGTSVDSF